MSSNNYSSEQKTNYDIAIPKRIYLYVYIVKKCYRMKCIR